jgi:hypothetical protein
VVTECHISCPACDCEVLVSGIVVGGGSYSLGDDGPPGCVFTEPVDVEDIAPARCPYCSADILATAAEALEYRAEAQWHE